VSAARATRAAIAALAVATAAATGTSAPAADLAPPAAPASTTKVAPAASSAPAARGAADPTPAARPAIDGAVLASQPEAIGRALRANVVLERDEGAGRSVTVAAGVILQLRDGAAIIATAQHVVDPSFTGALRAPAKPETLPPLAVTSVGGVRAPAQVVWLAPHGLDLALVSARLQDPEARAAARHDDAPLPKPGDRVFTVGNPQGGFWTRVDGNVKQQRAEQRDGFAFTLLWSDLAVQPGFGGGGLYDAQGRLVAIDSKRGAISSGLQGRALLLSTELRALVALAPAPLQHGD
jgi:S1-C subfamily serine protease